jgi:hypothetical protein
MERVSTRNGLSRPDTEIQIKNDAPDELRGAILSIAYGCDIKPSVIRQMLCTILARAPDRSNWSEFPNIYSEVNGLLSECEWFEVYDLLERIAAYALRTGSNFEDEINRHFRIAGIGWQIINQQVEMRGSEAFEQAVRQGQQILHGMRKHTAASELHEALQDLSRRPVPEVSGAIQHAMAALECVARDTCGSKDTLGDLIRRNPGLFPKPIHQIVGKAWGYTSNFGRHLEEGKPPSFEEAEMMVGVSGVLCRYLARRASVAAPWS